MLTNTLVAMIVLAAPSASPVKPAHNPLCPACSGHVNEKSGTVTVRGQRYRICCESCGAMLQKTPDKYLNPDGTPKNAKP